MNKHRRKLVKSDQKREKSTVGLSHDKQTTKTEIKMKLS